jgi:RNA polymerase sigma-70 factor, ECF subfamily
VATVYEVMPITDDTGELDDVTRVQRARRGNVASFEALARQHLPMVLALVRQQIRDSHAAEDIAQDALLKAYRNLAQLDDPQKFAPWLYRIAIREARRSVRHPAVLSAEGVAAPKSQSHPTAEDSSAFNDIDERRMHVRRAVAELEEPYRMVVTLHYLEGLDGPQIAQRLRVPHGTVRAQLSRARGLLQEKLRRHLK